MRSFRTMRMDNKFLLFLDLWNFPIIIVLCPLFHIFTMNPWYSLGEDCSVANSLGEQAIFDIREELSSKLRAVSHVKSIS